MQEQLHYGWNEFWELTYIGGLVYAKEVQCQPNSQLPQVSEEDKAHDTLKMELRAIKEGTNMIDP